MAKLAQTQEPSMEEILASIRRIITEDETGERPAADRGTRAPQRAEAQPKPAKRAVEEPEDDPEDVAESADVLELSEAQVTAVHESSESALSADADYPDPVHGLNGSPARGIVARDEPAGAGLLSANADATVTSAFSTLANTILSNEARTLEDIVREMLRPMLKAWLDDNLPPLVERLVRDEIERVSRGRR